MAASVSDRNLLFGILALQMDFISRDALIKGMNAWVLEKSKPLGQILAHQGALTADLRDFVEAMIDKHLQVHGNDGQKSLAAVGSASSVREELRQIADADLHASLAHVSSPRRAEDNALGTPTASVGMPTSSGLRFRILRPHARGGLGEVFAAQDVELNREVALKQIQDRHADNPESRGRFLLEAEITGGLEHPGIVPVYGLGTYADGRPFYAMRFIRGDSLMEAIVKFHKPRGESAKLAGADKNLQLHKLLRRLIDVCNALQYAHDRGVLHRDLKPGNIMLGKYGETLVVDWGLAKAGGAGQSSRLGEARPARAESPLRPASGTGSAETLAGSAIGTPAYMSPEQAAGRLDLIGPASDIYSLGATLYCLLTGLPPFKGELAVMLKKAQEGDFPHPRQINPAIALPLEAVCLKAMALQPEDRYATPQHLADDLEHWLADEAVEAWPEPWTVKMRRWARRHRTLVSSAAAVLLVAAVGSILGSIMLARLNGQLEDQNKALDAAQKVAKTRLDQSLKALGLFATDFRHFCEDALVPGENKTKVYEALIQQLENQVVDESPEASDDAFRNKAWMYQTMAIVYLDTQQRAKAQPIIEKGLRVCQDWLDLKPGDRYAMSFRAAFLSLKGDIQTTNDDAESYYRDVLKIRRELLGKEAVDQFTPGRSLMQLADTLDKLHEYDESLPLREQVYKVQVEKGADQDKLFETVDFWSWTCWKAYLDSRDEARKQELLEKADELSERTLKIRPRARRTLERWSGILRELGDRAYNQAKLAESQKQSQAAKQHASAAQKYYEKLANVCRELAIAPDLMHSQSNYARSYYTIGLMQNGLGKHKEARESFETSRHIREQLLRDFAKTDYVTMLQIDLLFSRVALGEHAEAVRAADEIRVNYGIAPGLSGLLYRLACIYSLSVAAVEEARAPNPLTDADRKLQAVYRDKALDALRRSHTNGNQDFDGTRLDADFIPIRDDPRFLEILRLNSGKRK